MYKHIRMRGTSWHTHPLLCLSVSVGQSKHEGHELRAAIDWIGATGKPWIIDLSDTLQRHNLLGQPLPAAHAEMQRRGDQWLDCNADLLARALHAPEIVRWDRWLDDPRFAETHAAVRRAAATDAGFASAIAHDVEKFTARGDGRQRAASIAFIWEECAALSLLGRDYNCCRIYPGHELQALQYLRAHAAHITTGYDRIGYDRFSIETRNIPHIPVQNRA